MVGGIVYLVGAGPGDPDLMTVKGRRCLEEADVVLYDDLVDSGVLGHVREGCERIYVGKRADFQAAAQEEIQVLLIERARQGSTVVRLKGGDPFVFGRGGEEAGALLSAGVRFEVVPGISSALAGPAYAGIPVTQRGVSASVTVVTGHEDPQKGRRDVDWEALARIGGTLVILMGAGNREKIASALIAGGRSPDTPVAAIRWATRTNQKTVRGRLGTLGELDVESPSVIVVGEVGALSLRWFESRPLFGRTVVVTRTREQASKLVRMLRDLGANVLEIPTVQIVDPADWSPADTAIDRMESYDWIVFSSPNGVDRFLGRIAVLDKDLRILKGIRIAAVGPATAEKVASRSLRADLCPAQHTAEGLAEALDKHCGVRGQRFLMPRPEVAREVVADRLREMGCEVHEAVVYRTAKPDALPDGSLERLDSGDVDLVTFSSSSTAQYFAELLGPERLDRVRPNLPAACIGPTTSRTAADLGFRVVAEPPPDDIGIPGLVRAILGYYDAPGGAGTREE